MNPDNPTTGEWTVKLAGSEAWAVYEGSQLIGNALDKMEAESIAHCHNAALAAEQELREEAEKEATLLRDQWLGEHGKLQSQLAAAVEALKFISEQGEPETSLKSKADAALAKIGGKP